MLFLANRLGVHGGPKFRIKRLDRLCVAVKVL
jgi:hypothetical protein